MTEAITAWRYWVVAANGELRSGASRDVWPKQERMESTCRFTPRRCRRCGGHLTYDGRTATYRCINCRWGITRERFVDGGNGDTEPVALCAHNDQWHHCGIHAFKDRAHVEAVARRASSRHVAWGRVSLWGRVIEHEDGYRAQYAYPLELLVPDSLGERERRGLSGYAVETAAVPMPSPVPVFTRLVGGPFHGERVPPSSPMVIVLADRPDYYAIHPLRDLSQVPAYTEHRYIVRAGRLFDSAVFKFWAWEPIANNISRSDLEIVRRAAPGDWA